MRIDKIKDTVIDLYKNGSRSALLLLGSAGIGKTETAYKIAEEMDLPLVALDLSLAEPSDLLGIPDKEKDRFTYLPMANLIKLTEKPGVLFLDEITNVERADTLSAALRLTLERKAGFLDLHPDTLVIAAGNRPEDSSIAQELPAPLLNRFIVFEVDSPKVEEWIQYMSNRYIDWDKRIPAFLTSYGMLLKPPQTPQTLKNYPTPRAWTTLAKISHKIKSDLEQIATGIVGEEATAFLMTFLNIKVPRVEDILANFKEIWTSLDRQQKFLSVAQVSQRDIKTIETFSIDLLKIKEHEYIYVLLNMFSEEVQNKIMDNIINKSPKDIDEFIKAYQDLSKYVGA